MTEYGRTSVPQRYRGNRIALTIRLPYDLYREVAIRAGARNWSLSDYVTWCVARELSGKFRSHNPDLKAPPGVMNEVRNLDWIVEPWVAEAPDAGCKCGGRGCEMCLEPLSEEAADG
jgi:hypothetical protein